MRLRSGRTQPAPVILVLAFVLFSLLLATDLRTQIRDTSVVTIAESPNSLLTTHFGHQFDADRVKTLARALALPRRPASSPLAQAHLQTPAFVLEMAFYLETAQHVYAASLPYVRVLPAGRTDFGGVHEPPRLSHGLRSHWEISSSWTSRRRSSAWTFNNSARARTVPRHSGQDDWRREVHCEGWFVVDRGHRRLRRVQRRLARHPPDRMGGGVGRTYPYLLESPLTFSGVPTDDHHMTDFAKEWALGEELHTTRATSSIPVKQAGAEFFAMNTAVLNYYRDHSGPTAVLTGLNDYLVNKSSMGKTLAEVYRAFAAFYLLSDKSPLVAFRVRKAPGSAVYLASTPLVGVVKTLAGKENAADICPPPRPPRRADCSNTCSICRGIHREDVGGRSRRCRRVRKPGSPRTARSGDGPHPRTLRIVLDPGVQGDRAAHG